MEWGQNENDDLMDPAGEKSKMDWMFQLGSSRSFVALTRGTGSKEKTVPAELVQQ